MCQALILNNISTLVYTQHFIPFFTVVDLNSCMSAQKYTQYNDDVGVVFDDVGDEDVNF